MKFLALTGSLLLVSATAFAGHEVGNGALSDWKCQGHANLMNNFEGTQREHVPFTLNLSRTMTTLTVQTAAAPAAPEVFSLPITASVNNRATGTFNVYAEAPNSRLNGLVTFHNLNTEGPISALADMSYRLVQFTLTTTNSFCTPLAE